MELVESALDTEGSLTCGAEVVVTNSTVIEVGLAGQIWGPRSRTFSVVQIAEVLLICSRSNFPSVSAFASVQAEACSSLIHLAK